MKAYIDKSAVVAEIEKELNTTKKYSTEYVNGKKYALNKILSFIDTLEVKEVNEEPVSNDLEDYAKKESESFAEREYEIDYIDRNALAKGYFWGVKDGAKWQKEQMEKEVDLEKEKIEWSEEDEEIMSGLLSFLLINTSDQWAKYGKWLKSLKQRIEDKL